MSPLARFERCEWKMVPRHLRGQMRRWLTQGIAPDRDFLVFLLKGQILDALDVAGPLETLTYHKVITFLREEVQLPKCWGSPANYETWRCLHGVKGMRDMPDRKNFYDDEARVRPPARLWPIGRNHDGD